MHIKWLKKAKEVLKKLHKEWKTIGSVHTLWALHEWHAILIRQSSKENDYTIVTVYPNKIQLFPWLKYQFDLQKDIDLAILNWADIVISSDDEEMFPDDYRTFITQWDSHNKLNSSVFPYASKWQVTWSIRWINFVQPTKTYFWLKDIEQAILVKRAVKDLLINTDVVYVPCIRFKDSWVPISSRLMNQTPEILKEVWYLYDVLSMARKKVLWWEKKSNNIINFIHEELNKNFKYCGILYIDVVDTVDFNSISDIKIPFIIHCAIRYDKLTHFDWQMILTQEDLGNWPPIIWI